MSEQDKPRVKFLDFTGGLNNKSEPFHIAENQYSDASNLIFDGSVPRTRDGLVVIDRDNPDEGDKVNGLHEYLYYNHLGVLTRCLICASAGTIQGWWWNGSAWVHMGNLVSGETAGLWHEFANFQNRLVSCNGTDKPKEINLYKSTTQGFPLGIKSPNRKSVIWDFDTTLANDHGSKFRQPSSVTGTSAQSSTWASQWELTDPDIRSNGESRLFTLDNATLSKTVTLAYGTALNLTQHLDGAPSDKYDDFCFDLFIEGWAYFSKIRIELDAIDGNFTAANGFIQYDLSQDTIEARNWGGNMGGIYKIKMPKWELEQGYTKNSIIPDQDYFNWANIKAIRFTVYKNFGGTFNTNVYLDYLRIEESAPIGYPDEKLISGFEWDEDWRYYLTNQAVPLTNFKTQGMTALAPAIAGVYTSFWRYINMDLSRWTKDVPVRPSDCIAVDVWANSACFALFGVRLYTTIENSTSLGTGTLQTTLNSGSSYGQVVVNCGFTPARMGAIKVDNGSTTQTIYYCGRSNSNPYTLYTKKFVANANYSVGNSTAVYRGFWLGYTGAHEGVSLAVAKPWASALPTGKWQTIYIPMGWIMNRWKTVKTAYTEHLSTSNPAFGTEDPDESLLTDADYYKVLQNVNAIRIGMTVVGAGTVYFDNLRLVKRPLKKVLATFNGIDIGDINIDISNVLKAADTASRGAPLVNATVRTLEFFNNLNPQVIHKDLLLGEQWSYTGCEFTYDWSVKTGYSSVRLKIPKGSAGIIRRSFNLSGGIDLTDFGDDKVRHTDGRPLFKNSSTGAQYWGVPSDPSDVICLDVCINKLNSIQGGAVEFYAEDPVTPANSTKYVYAVTAMQFQGKPYGVKVRSDDIPELVPQRVKEWGEKKGLRLSTETQGTEYTNDMSWTTLKMRKQDFAEYKSGNGASWANIKSVAIVALASKDDDVTVWLDQLVMRNAGALNGEYYYKVIYRSEDLQSAPSRASEAVICADNDVNLFSIPVPNNDTRIVSKDLYRMGGGSPIYRYVDTLSPDTTDYTDWRSDRDLGEALDEDFQEPPICKHLAVHSNRLFMANSKLHPARVYYSRALIAGAFPTNNWFDVEQNYGGEITRIISQGDDLIVFKVGGIYRVQESSKNDESYFYWTRIEDSIGCDNPRSVAVYNNIIYWVNKGRAYRLVGNKVDIEFGYPVEPYTSKATSTDPVNSSMVVGIIWEQRYLISYGVGTAANTKVLSFNIKRQVWESEHSGNLWNINCFANSYDKNLYAGSSSTVGGNKFPLVKLFSGDSDDGVGMNTYLITRSVSAVEKIYEAYQLWVATQSKNSTQVVLQITPIVDGVIKSFDTFYISETTPKVSRIPIKAEDVGSFFGIKIYCGTGSGFVKYLYAALEGEGVTDR